MTYTGCDLQIAVFLLLSLFWTKTRRRHQNAYTTTTTQPRRHSPTTPKPQTQPQASPRRYSSSSSRSASLRISACGLLIGAGCGSSLVRYKSRGIRGTKRREFLSSSRVHLPVRVAVGVPHSVPLEFISRCELQLEFLAQFLSSSSPGSRFVGGAHWRRSCVVVGRSCSC